MIWPTLKSLQSSSHTSLGLMSNGARLPSVLELELAHGFPAGYTNPGDLFATEDQSGSDDGTPAHWMHTVCS